MMKFSIVIVNNIALAFSKELGEALEDLPDRITTLLQNKKLKKL